MSEKNLRICFTSDIHAYIYPTDYRTADEKDIGLLKCANRFRKDGNTLVIDGGDILQGSPFGAFCHDSVGEAGAIAEIMNRCGYDYVTLGNHDFNYGLPYLNSYLEALDACCVCENLSANGETCYPYRIHTLENGLRIGIVGIVTDYVNVWEDPEHLQGIAVTDPFPAAKEALAALRGKVDLTVGVYHGGFERDIATGRELSKSTENIAYRLCRELGFDILLTGHQHMSVPGQFLSGTFVVQPRENGKEFIEIYGSVSSNATSFHSEIITAGGSCSADLLNSYAAMERGAQDWLDMVIGHMREPLEPSDHLSMAVHGSPLADFFNEVQLLRTGAQISASSMANEVSGLPRLVRRRDVLTAYPYTNTLVVLQISGSLLKEAIERSAEYFALTPEGGIGISESFLVPKVEHYNYDYYAGIDYTIDVSRPAGERVTRLVCGGEAVRPADRYTMCLSSYRASGTGGYECYRKCPVIREVQADMTELILDYFRTHPDTAVRRRGGLTVVR